MQPGWASDVDVEDALSGWHDLYRLESAAITKILNHQGLSSGTPLRSPAHVFDPFGSSPEVMAIISTHFLKTLISHPRVFGVEGKTGGKVSIFVADQCQIL